MPIKSALELALEKSKNFQLDEAALEANAVRQEGKKAMALFMENQLTCSLNERIEQVPKEKRTLFREAMASVLLSHLQLPTKEDSLEKLPKIKEGIASLAATSGHGLLGAATAAGLEKKVLALVNQIGQFFSQYLSDLKKVEEAIRKQYAPRLREKENQLSAQMGQRVRIDPMSDPEFAAFYKQNVSAAREQYRIELEKAKSELCNLLGVDIRQ